LDIKREAGSMMEAATVSLFFILVYLLGGSDKARNDPSDHGANQDGKPIATRH
jgi:hypothetical protein